MKITDYIVEQLKQYGVTTIFGYTGGSIADLIDSICSDKDMRFVETYTEQAAAFCANSYAQVSGNLGVAVCSSGPAVLNLLNGVANAYYDSLPCVFITGSVHSKYTKANLQIRQNAFQEMEVMPIVKSITKYCVYIDDPAMLPYELQKSVHIATHGRKGPVVIDIPYDIQRLDLPESLTHSANHSFSEPLISDSYDQVLEVQQALSRSKKPIVLVGGGCINHSSQLKAFLDRTAIPSVCSLRGIGIIPSDYPYHIGMIGAFGNQSANHAVYNCDLLLVLGSRLDDRQIGYGIEQFAPNAKYIQVDIDQNELGRKLKKGILINTEIASFFDAMNSFTPAHKYTNWANELLHLKTTADLDIPNRKQYIANNLIKYLCLNMPGDKIYSVDVGLNQMISAQILAMFNNGLFLSSSGLGCMGYSLPAIIGAYYYSPSATLIAITGDGGAQMNIQELKTLQREKIPAIIVVLNNHSLGMIKNLQQKMFHDRFHASQWGYEACDFSKIAQAYNFSYLAVKDTMDMVAINANELLGKQTIIEVIGDDFQPFSNPK